MLDNCNYDKWRTAEPDSFWQEDLGDAEAALFDAAARWRRDNYAKICELFEGYMSALRDAWEATTSADFDDHAGELLPPSGIEDEFDAARREVKRYEFNKRQGRHLGNL